MTRKSIVTIAVLTAFGVGVLGSGTVFAQTATNTATPMSSLVQKIADTFHLNKNDVQAVFDQDKKERDAQRQAQINSQLSKLVNYGNITEAQKQLILQKQKELEAQRENDQVFLKSLTHKERKSQMDAKRTELEKWAKQNGIDTQYLRFVMGGGRGFGHHGMMGPKF